MFLATDTAWAPWYVVHSDNEKRAPLNAITHIMSKIPYQVLPHHKAKLRNAGTLLAITVARLVTLELEDRR